MDAGAASQTPPEQELEGSISNDQTVKEETRISSRFSLQRMLSYAWRESLELARDPIRATMALVGSIILLFVMGYGITMDVDNLTFAVLDRDQSGLSQNYSMSIAGSRYFVEKPPLQNYEDLDQRMRSGDISLAIEIPPDFAGMLIAEKRLRLAPGLMVPCHSVLKQ